MPQGPLNFLALIEAKREGETLPASSLQELVSAYTGGQIPDYQMAAFLMAVYFRGLDPDETAALTLAMRDSGDRLRFPADSRPLVDKHSTGGVGDKVSLPLAPLLACLGFRVPMISGRGLGITGGTLDKLDSIPGFQTRLTAGRIVGIVQRVGCVICGQTERMVPADKKLYALRDVTGTIPSIPLIVASILSKKLAEDLNALLLDVKFGTAAFMSDRQKARELARAMVALGTQCGVNTRALLTDMNTPVGRAAGNWLEVKEAVACLEGGASGEKPADDLRLLVLECAAHLLCQTNRADSLDRARAQAEQCLDSGQPRRKWDEMLAAQGADLEAFRRKLGRDTMAPVVVVPKARSDGYISRCNARILGEVIRDLGGGRFTKEAAVNYDVGIDKLAKPGDQVHAGSTLLRLHLADPSLADSTLAQLDRAFEISPAPPSPESLIAELI